MKEITGTSLDKLFMFPNGIREDKKPIKAQN